MTKNCPMCGRFISDERSIGVPKLKTNCPECGSTKNWKDGKRYSIYGEIQRYICRDCGYRFSDQ